MKKFTLNLLAVALMSLFLTSMMSAAEVQQNFANAKFQTSIHNIDGKIDLENAVSEISGVLDYELDLQDAVLTVKFDTGKISSDQIIFEMDVAGFKMDLLESDEMQDSAEAKEDKEVEHASR